MKFNNTSPVYINAIGTAVPPTRMAQEQLDTLLTELYVDKVKPRTLELMHQLFNHPSVKNRFIAAANFDELKSIPQEIADTRIARFHKYAVALSKEASEKAIAKAGIGLNDISALIINTCTGYICPGISTYVSEALGLPANIPVYDLAGSGCGGAIPNLELAATIATTNKNKAVLSVSVEICSATFQMGDDPGLLVSNAIFGDGAAAAVLSSRPAGFKIIETNSILLPEHRELVRFTHKNGQLKNQLSSRLPAVVCKNVPVLIRTMLQEYNLNPLDIDLWAIHPGGEKILDGLQKNLELTDDHVALSRSILEEYGNMSSPSVLFVLEKIMLSKINHNANCVVTAFGAGMAAHSLYCSAQV
ncbi:MAG: type III polyketide synthase [Fibrobacteres bacterium]|nr:type III polyketide synthase [Fibrobacterota bacterium]